MPGVVERYLRHIQDKDWAALAGTLSDGPFERVGPFCDVIGDKSGYLAFLEDIVSKLEQYQLRIRRLTAADGVVCAEVSESFVLEGTAMAFPEVLLFDVGADDLITRVQVYMMRPGGEAVAPGGKAPAAEGGAR
jgi:hypothetical protein